MTIDFPREAMGGWRRKRKRSKQGNDIYRAYGSRRKQSTSVSDVAVRRSRGCTSSGFALHRVRTKSHPIRRRCLGWIQTPKETISPPVGDPNSFDSLGWRHAGHRHAPSGQRCFYSCGCGCMPYSTKFQGCLQRQRVAWIPWTVTRDFWDWSDWRGGVERGWAPPSKPLSR
jgi:hypothetical protein